jgi:hypothetical protein
MFLVETKESETNPGPNGLQLQLTINKKNNSTLKYVILQQDMSTMEWIDITDTCTTRNGISLVRDHSKTSRKCSVLAMYTASFA